MGLIYLRKETLEWPSIYNTEYQNYLSIMESSDKKEIKLAKLGNLLKINPMNKIVQKSLLQEIINEIHSLNRLEQIDFDYLRLHTEPFVGRAIHSNDNSSAIEIMGFIPLLIKYSDILPTLSQKQIINLADYSLKNKNIFLP